MPQPTKGKRAKRAKRSPPPPAGGKAEEPKLTDYVVLRRLQIVPATKLSDVFETPDNEPISPILAALQLGAWIPVLDADGKVLRVAARDGDSAIDAVTGKGEGALVGEWKYVAWSAWKGVTRVDPPLPILQDKRSTTNHE